MYTYIRTQWRRHFGLNVSAVDTLLFVGGQFRPNQWPQLHGLGIRAVLSLQEEREDRFEGPPPEASLRLLVRDFSAPSVAQLAEGVAFIERAHAAQLPVMVHCHAGVGRAPIMAAAYLVASRSLSHREALSVVRQARPIIGPNPAQVARLREYAAKVSGRR